MFLEARVAGCCSATFVLKLNDQPIGKYEGRWFSESLDLALKGMRKLEFRNVGWLSSQFELSLGSGRLVKQGWFGSAYEAWIGNEALAKVDRTGLCERGWIVDGGGDLAVEDMILIGLVYHTILQREAQHQQHGGAAAGT